MSAAHLQIGTIVTPGLDTYDEMIVGVVVPNEDAPIEHVTVVWFSDKRGVFWCTEAPGDLRIADLAVRGDISDPPLDHPAVAVHLWAEVMRTRER